MKTTLRHVVVPLFGILIGCVALAGIAMRFPIGTAVAVGLLLAAVVVNQLHRNRVLAVRGWRIGHKGRDRMYYEELRGGRLERFNLSCELLCEKPHHVIDLSDNQFPAWARIRREEITARIKSEFKPPGYEYINA